MKPLNIAPPLSRDDRKRLDSILAKLARKGCVVNCHADGSYTAFTANPKGNWPCRDLEELHQFASIFFG